MAENEKYEIKVTTCPECGETKVSFPWVPMGHGISMQSGWPSYCACDRARSQEAQKKLDKEFSERHPEIEHTPFWEGPNPYQELGDQSRELFQGKEGQNFEIKVSSCEICGMNNVIYPLVEVSPGNFMKAGEDVFCSCEEIWRKIGAAYAEAAKRGRIVILRSGYTIFSTQQQTARVFDAGGYF
ncbi:MAG: hypothetical protein WCT49_01175 [Candidatus Paceibacterota bacterium]|jgi:hypothetical protein|nr:hypothetical protein [Candidatus Paceibacterota bacterium]